MANCDHHYSLTGESAMRDGVCDLCGNPATLQQETLQPFDKMRPGEVDKVFQASCPKCDGRIWVFGGSGHIVDPDARVCQNCGYIHWLRGPNTSEVIPLPTIAGHSKKDRVRALVFALIAAPAGYTYYDEVGNRRALRLEPGKPFEGWQSIVKVAEDIDREIEATK